MSKNFKSLFSSNKFDCDPCDKDEKKSFSNATEVKVTFPGDKKAKKPDFIICGAGTTSIPLAYILTNKGYRVLMIEAGLDQSNNTVVTKPFEESKFGGTGPEQLNILNASFDPTVSSFLTNTDGLGDGWRTMPVWTGRGVGGGGLHFYLEYVRPTPTILDGPLPVAMIPPNNTSTYSFVEAGGSNWSSSVIEGILSNNVENFRQINGSQGLTENPSERGYNGPETITQLSPYPPTGAQAIIINALSGASSTVSGGTTSPSVKDYNIPENINSISQIQYFLDGTLTRQNSATSWANNTLVQPDGKGNLIGINGRKLVIWTNRLAVKSVRDTTITNSYRSAGVEFMHQGELYYVHGRNLISAMGAGYSPLFWQRSGVGPSDVLSKAKIPLQLNSPFIGKNLQNQYGPVMLLSTTNPALAEGTLSTGFVQYNNTPRRFQIIHAGFGPNALGIITPITFPAQPSSGPTVYYFYLIGFILEPRSRGTLNVIQPDLGQQPNVSWNFHSDGSDPNDPASGLSDPNSDITTNCAIYDYEYQVLQQLQSGGNPNDVKLIFPPAQDPNGNMLFDTSISTATRYPNLVPYITMTFALAAHESGTVVMNNDPSKGAIDGNLKLHGSDNCFEASSASTPVMNSGNTGSLEQALGYNGGSLIPNVAILKNKKHKCDCKHKCKC